MSEYKKKQEVDIAVKDMTSLSKKFPEEKSEPTEPLKFKVNKRKRFRKVFTNG